MIRNAFTRCIFANSITENISIIKRHAGHSKWQNIKHTKELKDSQRALQFTRLGRQMRVAIQLGGSPDPSKNLKLQQVVEQAKRACMPAATIQSIIKSAVASKEECKTYIIDIKGPGRSMIMCEVFTGHLHNTKQTIATLLRKNSGKFADSGLKHLFEEKGIIEGKHPQHDGKSESEIIEIATEHAIESGAEDVKVLEDNLIQFSCAAGLLGKVQEELAKIDYVISSASVEFIPIQLQKLTDSELEVCAQLCEKLESLPEVVKLYDNVA